MNTRDVVLIATCAMLLGSCVSEPKTPVATVPVETPAVQAVPVVVEPDIAELIANGDTKGLTALFKGREQADTPGKDGLYPLHAAAMKKSSEMVGILLAMGASPDPLDPDGKTPLRYSVDLGDAASAKTLIQKGASLFTADKAGVSPLDAAIAKGSTQVLMNAASVATKGAAGESPLHVAVNRLSIEAVKVILGFNPDLSARDTSGQTPLDSAFMHPASQDGAAIAELLISRNAPSGIDDFSYFIRAVRDTNYSRARFADGATVLHEAVRYDHRGYLSFFLERGVPIEAKNASGATALHDAIRLGRLEAAKILLSRNADPDAKDGNGSTALHLSLSAPEAQQSADMLLESRADPSIKDKSGNTTLHLAVELGYPVTFLETLLAKGAPVDAANAVGDTALAIAMRRQNAPTAALLAGKGASMFIRNVAGETPLSIALADGAETTGILIGASNKAARDDSGDSPYHYAVRLGSSASTIGVMKDLGLDASSRNNEGDTALHVAARSDAAEQGLALLEASSDPFAVNAAGITPLEIALHAKAGPLVWFFSSTVLSDSDSSGNGPLHYAAMAGLAEGVQFLATEGVPIDARNKDGQTPLMLALRKDSTGTVNVLLALGADTDARDSSGSTALHMAIYWNAFNCLQLLANSAKNLDPRDYTGKTPLRDAIDKGDAPATAFLLENGADPLARDNSGETPLHAAARQQDSRFTVALASKLQKVEVRDDAGATPLLEAVYAENSKTVKVLASIGASIHARDSTGESPLSYALKKGGDVLQALLYADTAGAIDADGRSVLRVILDTKPTIPLIEQALAAGASPNDRDAAGRSPLHIATTNGFEDILSILVAAGADIFVKDAAGSTPAGLALARGDSTIVAMFGSSPDVSDYLGETALHYAAAAGLEKAVQSLLALGADATLLNAAGETPADVATRRGNTAIAQLLEGK